MTDCVRFCIPTLYSAEDSAEFRYHQIRKQLLLWGKETRCSLAIVAKNFFQVIFVHLRFSPNHDVFVAGTPERHHPRLSARHSDSNWRQPRPFDLPAWQLALQKHDRKITTKNTVLSNLLSRSFPRLRLLSLNTGQTAPNMFFTAESTESLRRCNSGSCSISSSVLM